MKILHIIPSLENGGAEGVLARICVNDKKNNHIILCLSSYGFYSDYLEKNKIPIIYLNCKKKKIISKLFLLCYHFIRINPDVYQSWMYEADFLSSIAKISILSRKKLYWGIRHSNFSSEQLDFKKKITLYTLGILSKFIPKKIISCSFEGIKYHLKYKYSLGKFVVIPNGYDPYHFKKSLSIKNKLRKKFKILKGQIVIGMVGRFHPQKSHDILIKSLSYIKKDNFILLLVGRNINENNSNLKKIIKTNQRKKYKIILLDSVTNINEIYNLIDINVLSSSFGEGFPNVLAEGMLSESVTISSNVGDAQVIVTNKNHIFNINNYLNLTDLINQKLENISKFSRIGYIGRNKIKYNYDLSKMINKFIMTWMSQ